MSEESRRRGILRLYHLKEVAEAKAEEQAEQRARFEKLADPASAPRVATGHNLFQTPEALAARVVRQLKTVGRVLEPSAGLGRLYRAVRAVDPTAPVTLVDNSPTCFRELYHATEGDPNATLRADDFLSVTPAHLGLFDSIVMNPPFERGTDIRHVNHARRFLAPGGKLVSIVAAGPKQRAAFHGVADIWSLLPAFSFRSEGTDVETALVIFNG